MGDNKEKEFHAVVLGALLHDIGKFMQRAEVGLAEGSKGMESTICPVNNRGGYTHKHVLWTDHFFEKCLAASLPINISIVSRLASFHHKPEDALTQIITQADWLSSGMDRDAREKDEEGARDAFKRIRLRSVFENVSLDYGESQSTAEECSRFRYEFRPLGPDTEVAFPVDMDNVRPREGELLVGEYMALWKEFETELKRVSAKDFRVFLSTMNRLLERYTWCIPSSTMDYPDISLYDHLKTTAAIASCLYLFHEPDLDEGAIKDMDKEKYLLLLGDLSGIQDYIFNITHIGAGGSAKRLRARSFMVSMLTEIIADRFVHEVGLTEANILMSSGGKFHILLPRLDGIEERVEEITGQITQWLYENMNAELGLNIATMRLAGSDFKDFDRVFKEINRRLQENKQSPHLGVIASGGGWASERFVLKHVAFKDEEKLCRGCGRFPGTESEDGTYFCWLCEQDRRLGTRLPNARYVAFYRDDYGRFTLLGSSFDLCSRKEEIKGSPYLVRAVTDWSHDDRFPMGHRYMANYVPLLREGECDDCTCPEKDDVIENLHSGSMQPMMFECIAKRSEGWTGLSYLKADVDNLGKIMAFGLKRGSRSVSRLASISRMLDYFFSGHVEKMIREKFDDMYTVYSGGDDLLLIGPWNRVMDFAAELEGDFRRFTCGNKDITLSAGIAMVKHRLPVFRSVQSADAALKDAKERPPGGGRNQVSLMGEEVGWKDYGEVIEEGKKLSEWIERKVLSRGFVRNLQFYAALKQMFGKDGNTKHLRYLPLMTYDIARNLPSPEKDKIGVRRWAEELKIPDSRAMRHMRIIAEYALISKRGG